MNAQDIFKEIWPILQKASPLLCQSLTSPYAKIACAILAVVANAPPSEKEKIANNLSNDPDLYAKLSNLESTHGQWLSYFDKSQ